MERSLHSRMAWVLNLGVGLNVDPTHTTFPTSFHTYTCTPSLAWPDPSRSRKGEEEKGGGEKEEGSGDSEQDAVSQWNVIIKLILRIT